MALKQLLANMLKRRVMTNLREVSVEEFRAAHGDGSGATVIDVRNSDEYDAVHVKGAQLFPLPNLDPETLLGFCGGDQAPIYVLCKAGGRARKAADQIAPLTSRDVCVVAGGTDACVDAGLPLG